MGLRDNVLGTTSNTFAVGDGRAGDKYLQAETAAATVPFIRYNDTAKRWELSHDGTSVQILGLFGTEAQQGSKAAAESVTGTTWTQYYRFATSSLPAGTYRIAFWYQWNQNSVANSFEGRVQVDDTTQIFTHVQEPQDPAATQRNTTHAFAYVTLTAGSHNIDIDYRAGSAATTARMLEAAIEIWRVS